MARARAPSERMSDVELVETPAALHALCTELSAAPMACLDAEGPGHGAYPDRLCLLVLGVGARIFVVDPLAVDVSPLAGELARPERPLVVHDVAYDARLLALAGLPLGCVHDTSVAATMLGRVKTGLASLAEELLGVVVDKSLQASAWGRRPLEARALDYLAQDAELPVALYTRLWPELEERDLVDETLAETQHRIRKAGEAVRLGALGGWWKLAFARGLGTQERRWLRSAWSARARVATDRDRSPALLLSDDELERLVKSVPTSVAELGDRMGRRVRDAPLVEALAAALDGAQVPVPDAELAQLDAPVPTSAERERAKRLRKRLVAWRDAEAERRGVGGAAVLPGHLADRLAGDPGCLRQGPELLSGMGTRRWQRYGDALRSILEDR